MKMYAYHRHHIENPWFAAPPWALEIFELGLVVLNRLETIMATLDETLAEVTAEDTKIDSLIALVSGLEKQLSDALAGTTLPPAVQQKIDAVFAQAKASADKIDAAITANTPPTTPATP